MTRRQVAIVGLALGVGVALRLGLAIAFFGNYDERSYEIVAEIERRGANVYAETARYNYTPAWALIVHALDTLAIALRLPLHAVIRGFLTLVDVANAVLIGRIGRAATGARASTGFVAYLLNPVAILIVGFHGQFETLAALPLLAAIAVGGRARPGTGPIQWALGTASLVLKHIVAFQFWMLFWYAFTPRRRLLALAASAVVFAASFLPYLPGGLAGIEQNVFGYGGLRGIYGFGVLLPNPLPTVLFIVVMTALPVLATKGGLDAPRAIQLSSVALLATIFGIGEQYFLIPILFSTAFRGPWYWAYTVVATLFLLASPNNVFLLSLPPLWNLVWLVALGWFVSLAFGALQVTRDVRRVRSPRPA